MSRSKRKAIQKRHRENINKGIQIHIPDIKDQIESDALVIATCLKITESVGEVETLIWGDTGDEGIMPIIAPKEAARQFIEQLAGQTSEEKRGDFLADVGKARIIILRV